MENLEAVKSKDEALAELKAAVDRQSQAMLKAWQDGNPAIVKAKKKAKAAGATNIEIREIMQYAAAFV